ncbi:MAG TPA: hypothetical protein VK503_00805 [Candidatus Bathyarchaeia archaeon]|nr:hypothetical protein [Candidatus Bathyarchaeia archaeon]
MKRNRAIGLSMILMLTMLMSFSTVFEVKAGPVRAVVIRIDSVIDYATIDLVQRAIEEVQNRDGAIMIIELNANQGYLQPTVEVIQRLVTTGLKIVVYVGPKGASALSFPAYLAMAGNTLVMNDGTSIGAAGLNDPNSINHMMNVMRSLAKANGRDVVATESMITDNVVYSADEALAKGICDRKITNFSVLLVMLNIDPSNLIIIQRNQLSADLPGGNAFMRLIATHSFVELMFITLALLVAINIGTALRRRRKWNDEPYQALLNLLRMEISSLEGQKLAKQQRLTDTPLYTPVDIPQPTTIQRIPTPPVRMLQKTVEVNEN